MLPWLGAHCGNEHSLHAWGREARAAVEEARTAVAEVLGAEDPSQIVFTSGATEGNNAVIAQFDRVAFSAFEHSSVREAAMVRQVWWAAALPPNPPQMPLPESGNLRGEPELPCEDLPFDQAAKNRQARRDLPRDLPQMPLTESGSLRGEPDLYCQMAVSNETGEIFVLPQTEAQTLVDATQAVGKVPYSVGEADYVTVSAHKFGGPKGMGALYLRDPESFRPLLLGGGHEHGLRSGTLNVPGIVGLGVAAKLARRDQGVRHQQAVRLREAFTSGLVGGRTRVNEAENQSPFIVSVTCFGCLAEAVVVEVDNRGFGISAGAACGSENPQASPGHLARGMTVEESRSTVRISFGPGNTVESAGELARCLVAVVDRLS